MAELKGRREVERRGGFCDRLANFGAAMPGVAAPEARRPVEDRPSVGALIVHSVRRHDLARVRLEPAIGGEGHPEGRQLVVRSEEHTSELQSLMRISYAVFCLKKKQKQQKYHRI